ncbi:MAG: hypothetical protein JW779_01530 [Candidatus Thorarchaeota archaeon]|nr:hypothetical protein [Candidatus Thorarchaeota archaeon]
MQIDIPASQEWYHLSGFISIFVAITFAVFLFSRKDSSAATKTYIFGAIATFWAGGFLVNYFWIVLCHCTAYWTSPFGLIGGYALIALSFVQYWFDKKRSNVPRNPEPVGIE